MQQRPPRNPKRLARPRRHLEEQPPCFVHLSPQFFEVRPDSKFLKELIQPHAGCLGHRSPCCTTHWLEGRLWQLCGPGTLISYSEGSVTVGNSDSTSMVLLLGTNSLLHQNHFRIASCEKK
jgi:hypothetical protein